MWLLAVLTGDRINVFFIKKCMAVLPGRETLAVITGRPYYRGGRKAGFYCIVFFVVFFFPFANHLWTISNGQG